MERNKYPTWMNFKPLSQSHAEKLTSSFLWSFPFLLLLLLEKQHFVSFPQPFGNKHESSIKKVCCMLHAIFNTTLNCNLIFHKHFNSNKRTFIYLVSGVVVVTSFVWSCWMLGSLLFCFYFPNSNRIICVNWNDNILKSLYAGWMEHWLNNSSEFTNCCFLMSSYLN